MSYFTKADAEYIKKSIVKIRTRAFLEGFCFSQGDFSEAAQYRRECDEELARLGAFVDGCTLDKGKEQ